MVDFSENFKESFILLKSNIFLIIPFAISQLIFFSFIFSTLHYSGISEIMVSMEDLKDIDVNNLDDETLRKIETEQLELMSKFEHLDFNKIYFITGIGLFAFLIFGTFFAKNFRYNDKIEELFSRKSLSFSL
jgi:hypothetical protein